MKLQLTFTIIACMVFTGSFAQIPMGDYTIYADPDNTDYPSYDLNENRINLVILAEGYAPDALVLGVQSTNNTYEHFEVFKDALLTKMFGNAPSGLPYNPPFNRYRNYFNVFWVWVESEHGGAGCLGSPYCDGSTNPPASVTHSSGCSNLACLSSVDNYFGCAYDINDLHRLLFPEDPLWVLGQVQNVMFGGNTTAPLAIILSVNSRPTVSGSTPSLSEFGGGGHWDVDGNGVGMVAVSRYSYLTDPTDPDMLYTADVALHEIGHNLSGLLDEYWYDMSPETNEADNRQVADTDPSPTWGEWQDLDYPTPPDAAIEVAQHRFPDNCDGNNLYSIPETFANAYKPTDDGVCKMQRVTNHYCAVCKESIIEHIHDVVDPYDEDDISPAQGTTHPASSSLIFDPAVIDTDPSYMQVKWFVNGELVETIFGNGSVGGTTDFTWQFDCSNSDLIIGDNTIKAEIFDVTGIHDETTPYDDDTRLVREANHTTDHKHEIDWTVHFSGEVTEDLWLRDFANVDVFNNGILYNDIGEEPFSPWGWFFDQSPDIKVTQDDQGSAPFTWANITHENPDIAANDNFVYVQVHNRGCETSTAGEDLGLYTTIAGSWDSWPNNWNTLPLGYQIGTGSIPAIAGGESATVEIPWTVQDLVSGQPNWETCLLARIEGVANDLIIAPQPDIANWIWQNNNIAMHNVTVIDLFSPDVVELNNKPYPGGWVYVGNTGDTTENFDIQLIVNNTKKDDLHNEAEIVLYLKENGFDISGAIADSNLVGLTRLDSTLFLVTADNARIKSISVPGDTLIPAYVGYAFLTQEVSDTLNYTYHLGQYVSNEPDTLISGQHFLVNRVTRNLFTANAGNDVEILVGDSTTLSASTIGETTIFNWYDDADVLIDTTQSTVVSPSATTTYKVEVIAEDDGYKDYDNVIVTVTKGQITSVIPNPTSTTTVVSYKTANITTASLKVVEVNTGNTVDNFSITAGTGTKTIDASGYNTGAHIITLVGDGNDLNTETLVVQ